MKINWRGTGSWCGRLELNTSDVFTISEKTRSTLRMSSFPWLLGQQPETAMLRTYSTEQELNDDHHSLSLWEHLKGGGIFLVHNSGIMLCSCFYMAIIHFIRPYIRGTISFTLQCYTKQKVNHVELFSLFQKESQVSCSHKYPWTCFSKLQKHIASLII